MASNKDIYELLQKIGNGEGIEGIKSSLDELKQDIHEIKEEIFNKQDSLRNRVTYLEKEDGYLKDKLKKLDGTLVHVKEIERRLEVIELRLKSKSDLWSKAWLHILLVGLGFIVIFVLERVIG